MSTTIVGVYICTVRTEDHPFWYRCPPSRSYALLDSFFKRIGQIMPTIAIVVERKETSMRPELNTKARNVSPTHMSGAIHEPGFELRGKIVFPCRWLANALSLQSNRFLDECRPLLTDYVPTYSASSQEIGAIPSEIDAIYLLDLLSDSNALLNVFQRIGQLVTISVLSA